jgi:hypothetical protein
MGPMDPFEMSWQAVLSVDRAWSFGGSARFRLLARRGMIEFYLDDHLIECYTLGCPDGKCIRLGIPGRTKADAISDVCAWHMSLPRGET